MIAVQVDELHAKLGGKRRQQLLIADEPLAYQKLADPELFPGLLFFKSLFQLLARNQSGFHQDIANPGVQHEFRLFGSLLQGLFNVCLGKVGLLGDRITHPAAAQLFLFPECPGNVCGRDHPLGREDLADEPFIVTVANPGGGKENGAELFRFVGNQAENSLAAVAVGKKGNVEDFVGNCLEFIIGHRYVDRCPGGGAAKRI